jgi:primary-amine oxidase
VTKNAICIHEEDTGIAWKHTNFLPPRVEVRRMRRLVVSSIATIGNYVYGFYWHFYQDGKLELEVKLTGIISPGVVTEGESPEYGVMVAPGIYGPNHQHFFTVRLDVTVDGPLNSVVECDSVRQPVGDDNPHGNAWVTEDTVLERESEAARTVDTGRARFWRIVNPDSRNRFGQPAGYRLNPGPAAPPLLDEGSPAMRRRVTTSPSGMRRGIGPRSS